MKAKIITLLWMGTVLLVDQVSKALVLKAFPLNEPRGLLGDLLRISVVLNRGGIFGLGQGLGNFFLILSIGALLFALYLLRGTRRSEIIGLLMGGAVGNLIDRLRYGAVVDFIDIGYKGLRWPVFNIADLAITLGMALMFLNWIKGK